MVWKKGEAKKHYGVKCLLDCMPGARVSTTYLYPSVENIILWLGRVHVLAVVKVIGRYHHNWRCVKLFSEIVNLSGHTGQKEIRDQTGRQNTDTLGL